MRITVWFLFLSTGASAASSSLQFVPQPNVTAQGALPMPNGSVAIFGAATRSCGLVSPGSPDQTQTPLLSILDISGNQITALCPEAFGHGNSSIAAAALEAGGNIWIAGQTDSDDFPLVHALFTNKPDYQATGFAAKLDPSLNILFSTFLGGASSATNIALDISGNAYIAGSTQDPGFPVTAPVFGTGMPSPSSPPTLLAYTFAFLAKISSDGSRLLYSRLLGGNGGTCSGLSCQGVFTVYTTPSAIAVDGSGNLTVAGSTNATNFPVTPNVYQTGGGAFVSRVSADGSHLIWSTEFGTTATGEAGYVVLSSAFSIALDSTNNVYIAGSNGSLETTGFVARLSSDATQLVYTTSPGGLDTTVLAGLALDSAGNVWVAGHIPNGLDFALELNASLTAGQQTFSFITGTVTQPPAFDSNGELLLLGSSGNLLRLNPATALSVPAVMAVTNAAVPAAAAGVSPGEIVTLYGPGLGPPAGVFAGPDANGLYPKQLDGVSVQFQVGSARAAAPLLYVGPYQINLQVPFIVSGPVTISVASPGGTLPPMNVPVIGSIGVFGAVNQDGSINGAANPAREGSVVSLYVTGLGFPFEGAQDGAVSTAAMDSFQQSVEVTTAGTTAPLPVLYAGTAPGSINGLAQINVLLPTGLAINNPSMSVEYPGVVSNPIAIYTH